MSIPCTGVIATDADLQCKERQDRYVRLDSGDVALHPRENAELDAAILQRETCRRVVGITAADLDAMDFPPINWIVPTSCRKGSPFSPARRSDERAVILGALRTQQDR
jgi:hypothetical protein